MGTNNDTSSAAMSTDTSNHAGTIHSPIKTRTWAQTAGQNNTTISSKTQSPKPMKIGWDKELTIDEIDGSDLTLPDTLMSLNDILDSDRWINCPSSTSSPANSTHLLALSATTHHRSNTNPEKMSQTDNKQMLDKSTMTEDFGTIQDTEWDSNLMIELLIKAPMMTTAELWSATATSGHQPTFADMESFTHLTQILRRMRLRTISFAASKLLASNSVRIP